MKKQPFTFIIFIFSIIFFTGCSTHKPTKQQIVTKSQIYLDTNKTKPKPKKTALPKPGTDAYTLYQLSNEISKKLSIPIIKAQDNIKDFQSNMIIKKGYNYIEIIFKKQNLFDNGISTLLLHIKNQLTKLAQIIKKYPQTIIQVIGYTDDKITQSESDERAINIAEILFNSGLRNEIYAKGCSKRYITNKKVAIFIYPKLTYMRDNCRN